MKKTQLIVRRLSARAQRGFVEFGPFRWPCALGRSGIKAMKREGDGATPRGRYKLLFVYHRPGRVLGRGTAQHGALPLRQIKSGMGWCDAPDDPNYNRQVRYPYRASAETLCRDDELYDAIVVLDYNIRPRVRGRGSAIFMHIARPGYKPTEGCVALSRPHLKALLRVVPRKRPIAIQ